MSNGLERPVPDVVEQDQDVIPDGEELPDEELPHELPLEANAADAAEQERTLEIDEDDYR